MWIGLVSQHVSLLGLLEIAKLLEKYHQRLRGLTAAERFLQDGLLAVVSQQLWRLVPFLE